MKGCIFGCYVYTANNIGTIVIVHPHLCVSRTFYIYMSWKNILGIPWLCSMSEPSIANLYLGMQAPIYLPQYLWVGGHLGSLFLVSHGHFNHQQYLYVNCTYTYHICHLWTSLHHPNLCYLCPMCPVLSMAGVICVQWTGSSDLCPVLSVFSVICVQWALLFSDLCV